jgi:PAS domain S-box-containing protein
MIWTSDTKGHCLTLNRSLRDFWGVAEDAVATFDWRETMHPDDIDHIGQAMMQATVKRESVVVSGRYRKADGSWRILRTEAHPRFSRKGRFLGMIGVNVDTTETEMAQAALRERQERLRVALAAGRMGTWRHDMQTGEQDWDERQYELFGVDRSLKPTRALFLSLVHPDDLDKIAFGDETFLPDRFLDSEFRIVRPDGETRWITAHSITRNDAAGQPIEMIGVNFDTTERRETEDRLRLLLDELKHRVKNTLAVVQAIAHQTFRERNADPAALRAFEGRLIALANAHNLLTSSDWESALLSEIAADALRLQGIEGNRFALGGPLIILPAKHALAVALALHELCTNALKHGALSNDSGRVELTWQKADPPRPSL